MASKAHDDQWRETIILASGTRFGGVPFGDKLITTLVEKGESNSGPTSVKAACIALALACCETAQQVNPELKQRVLTHLNVIAPPHTLEMADMLAAGGDAVLPWLEYRKLPDKSVGRVAAAARTLARIGTEQAARMLIDPRGYGSDDRATVVAEACSCALVHPADFAHVIKGKSETAKRLLSFAVFDSSRVLTESAASYLHHVFDADFSSKQLTDISRIILVPNVKYLNIAHNPLRDLSPLAFLHKLLLLDISGLTEQALDTLPILPNVNKLNWFHYARRSISISLESVIAKLPNLSWLYISNARFPDFEAILALSHLQSLSITWCPPESLAAASSHPTLQQVFVSGNQMQMVADLLITGTNFPALRHLRILHFKNSELLKEIQSLRPNLHITAEY